MSTRARRRLAVALQIVQGLGLGVLLAGAVLILLSTAADLPLFRYQQF